MKDFSSKTWPTAMQQRLKGPECRGGGGGGARGMTPNKIFKIWPSEMNFPALWGRNFLIFSIIK